VRRGELFSAAQVCILSYLGSEPMSNDILGDVAAVAESLQFLIEHPTNPVSETYEARIQTVLSALARLPLPHTLGVAGELDDFSRNVLRGYGPKNSVNGEHQTKLASIAATVRRALANETKERPAVTLDESAVVGSLRTLPRALPYLTIAQQALREETIRCLEIRSFRSAIVLGWSFAYDYVRHWVFTEKRDQFNPELINGYQRGGKPLYQPVSHYEDFWEQRPTPGEWVVLETCERAGIITGKPYTELTDNLRLRNNYAHANFLTPSADITKGIIASLLRTITSPPFPEPKQAIL
jgi:hypothetical protein